MTTPGNIEASGPLGRIASIDSVYFIGIGGIGMSALARYFHSRGVRVSGYDRTSTDLTKELEAQGIAVHYSEDVSNIPKEVDLVVFTPAVPDDHAELKFYRENGYPVVKRSDVLQAVSHDSYNICIAGTHGKTTISTMTAHVLRHSGYGCNAFLGGISVNYQTNFWSSERDVCVIEADEYDRSFLKLTPDIAVITAMDADHLDIYGDEKNMQDAFVQFGNQVKPEGILISKFGLARVREIKAQSKMTYSLQNDAADIYASDVKISGGGYTYNIHLPGATIQEAALRIGGMHNVENSLVAAAVAHELGIDHEQIRSGLDSFRGVKRRFEYIIPPRQQEPGAYVSPVLVDDYAHHPEELSALLKSVRALFPQRVMTVIFQPHLFTRTRDLADGFARVLDTADNLVLLPVYPAREEPIAGVTSEMILRKMRHASRQIVAKEQLAAWMQDHPLNKEFGEVIVMAGAGDIDMLVQPMKKIIENK